MCSWTKQEQASCHPNNLSVCEILSLIFWGLSGNGRIPADVKTWRTYQDNTLWLIQVFHMSHVSDVFMGNCQTETLPIWQGWDLRFSHTKHSSFLHCFCKPVISPWALQDLIIPYTISQSEWALYRQAIIAVINKSWGLLA